MPDRRSKAGLSFADAHIGLLAAATGDRIAAANWSDVLTRLVEGGALAAGPVVPAIRRAALAFVDADCTRCACILEPVAGEVVRIGGSGAQREVVEDTLLPALMRSGESAKARDLLTGDCIGILQPATRVGRLRSPREGDVPGSEP
jgi:hypothetical protein